MPIFSNRQIRLKLGGSLAKVAAKSPVEFHVIEDGKLIILGAFSANSHASGLYLDCEPEWASPVQDGNVLTLEQVYSATQNGNVLEVE